MKKRYKTMEKDLLNIIRNMQKDGFTPKHIVGIARGGLIPATMLSHWYQIPLTVVSASYYDFGNKNDLGDFNNLLFDHPNDNILIVDDICDTGITLKEFGNLEKRVKIAALVHNEACDYTPDYVGTSINKAEDPSWIIFPWENWWE